MIAWDKMQLPPLYGMVRAYYYTITFAALAILAHDSSGARRPSNKNLHVHRIVQHSVWYRTEPVM